MISQKAALPKEWSGRRGFPDQGNSAQMRTTVTAAVTAVATKLKLTAPTLEKERFSNCSINAPFPLPDETNLIAKWCAAP